jgi:hypothetical protein
MAWGFRWYLVGGVILGGVLAGCSGFMFAEREAWRREAELQCLQSGAVREGAGVTRIDAIRGSGSCGADFPLKVSTLGDSPILSFAEGLRPPGAIRPTYSTAAPVPGAPSYDPPFGASRAPVAAPVAVTPPATLACPMVSELERWIATSVQPAAMRWFGTPVSEIRQISAYSCRGMNGNPRARISEHSFGNALDIASFTLADGRTITVKGGWRGLPEEQGFLRDVQAAACDQFATVLAPGSNVYHYDHIHVDLMRRHSGHRACNPAAVSGEEVAARAAGTRYAGRRAVEAEPRYSGRRVAEPDERHSGRRAVDPSTTGALTMAPPVRPRQRLRSDPDEDHRFPALPLAEPGNDGAEAD